jgi:hypothetical protein
VIHEENHHGQVVIEFEQLEVGGVDAREPDTDELIGDVFDLLETDNLPVKLAAVNSRHAAHEDHHGLAGFLRQRLALGQGENPAVPGGVEFAPAAFLLSQNGVIRRCDGGKNDDKHCALHHILSSGRANRNAQ